MGLNNFTDAEIGAIENSETHSDATAFDHEAGN